ncbi:type II secretion system F family protein [Francisella sp. SYW-9]|uniref:type II secretion system F family protein n=1 Tax=Francisella sp. SYW-9 TaxID=2610888 RepID=UPI00123D18BE|nr:type II secretion system F family protein [Francisella sp. SYW-9]
MFGKKRKDSLYSQFKINLLKMQFSGAVRADFYKTMAMMLGSGFDIGEYLERRKASIIKFKRKYFDNEQYLVEIIDDILFRYNSLGFTFSEAIKIYITNHEYMILSSSGDGNIEQSLENMISISAKLNELSSAIIKSMMKPISLTAAIIGLMYFSATKVMPIIVSSIPANKLPAFTMSFYKFNKGFLDLLPFSIAGIFLIVLGFYLVLPRYKGGLRRSLFDFFPVFSVYKSIVAIRFMISLSLLLQNKQTSLNKALMIMHDRAKPYLQDFIKMIIMKVSQGTNPGEALSRVSLFNRRISSMIDIYTNSGKLEIGLKDLSYEYLEAQMTSIKAKFGALNIVVMLLTSLYICAFMWSIYAIGIGATGSM